jgi:hypothetical protein
MKETFPRLLPGFGKVRGTEPEPMGVEFSVTNLLPLPSPCWGTESKGEICSFVDLKCFATPFGRGEKQSRCPENL